MSTRAGVPPREEHAGSAVTPGVDVIVVNYRTPVDLGRFLDSYDAGHPDDAMLWIVNVCALGDDVRVTDRYLTRRQVNKVVALNTEENIGYNRAVNRAGSRGEREFVAVFNADVELTPSALNELVDSLRVHPAWGVVGPRQIDEKGRLTAPGIFGTSDAPKWRCWREDGRDGRYSDVRDDCVTVLGSAFVMRRDLWDRLTGCYLYRDVAPNALGPMLPCSHYYGETAAMYHAAAHGSKLAYLGTTTIQHRWHSASPVGGIGERSRDVDQAYFRRFCSHHGIPAD